MKCSECGREIQNAYFINGKAYGYNCYKQKLALFYKQWEDERNAEYSVKCFSAMQIFEGKKSNSFHDSICKQWNECKKLTAKQLECIIKGFTDKENIEFWMMWQQLSNDECLKRSVPAWIEKVTYKAGHDFSEYMENEAFINCMLYDHKYRRSGFHFYRDPEISEKIYIMENGKNNHYVEENIKDGIEVLKIVEGIQK